MKNYNSYELTVKSCKIIHCIHSIKAYIIVDICTSTYSSINRSYSGIELALKQIVRYV